MSHISIKAINVTSKSFSKDGKNKTLHFQRALLVRNDGVVLPVDLIIKDLQSPHAVGDYEIADDSFSTGSFPGQIQFRLTLGNPLPKAKAA